MFTFFTLVLMASGFGLLYRGCSARAEARRSLIWPSAEGVVLTSSIESKEFQNDDHLGTIRRYRPAVTYSFSTGGKERKGTDIAIGMNNLYGEQAVAEQHAGRYPVGKKVRVYYDPTGTVSVLEPGNTRSANMIVGIGFGFLITSGLLLLVAFKVG